MTKEVDMTIQTAELKMYGTVAVPGYTGLTFLGKKLGKVVGDPFTIALAETMAPRMTPARTPAQKKAPIPPGPALDFTSVFRPLAISDGQRVALEQVVQSQTAPYREVERAKTLLAALAAEEGVWQ